MLLLVSSTQIFLPQIALASCCCRVTWNLLSSSKIVCFGQAEQSGFTRRRRLGFYNAKLIPPNFSVVGNIFSSSVGS
ncbi:hypothetical protein LIPSTDRAFT_72449 [Lipomyces starkeyi NRRL Y-11557]|uniref:Secreted protein n=1 Tax=Lipomyces starkeyi NRRL Y-11557 TaxID=675824 RepID=A0A1E3Q5F4_LIPST|nr:hypothetical protein LIPSTDRAFT_72449 [Lipomyces starkeyi NRRL Y-11557]